MQSARISRRHFLAMAGAVSSASPDLWASPVRWSRRQQSRRRPGAGQASMRSSLTPTSPQWTERSANTRPSSNARASWPRTGKNTNRTSRSNGWNILAHRQVKPGIPITALAHCTGHSAGNEPDIISPLHEIRSRRAIASTLDEFFAVPSLCAAAVVVRFLPHGHELADRRRPHLLRPYSRSLAASKSA